MNIAARNDALQEGLELVARVQMATAELPRSIAEIMPELSAPLAEIDTLAAMVQTLIEAEMAGAEVESSPATVPA
jgi:dihydroorotase